MPFFLYGVFFVGHGRCLESWYAVLGAFGLLLNATMRGSMDDFDEVHMTDKDGSESMRMIERQMASAFYFTQSFIPCTFSLIFFHR